MVEKFDSIDVVRNKLIKYFNKKPIIKTKKEIKLRKLAVEKLLDSYYQRDLISFVSNNNNVDNNQLENSNDYNPVEYEKIIYEKIKTIENICFYNWFISNRNEYNYKIRLLICYVEKNPKIITDYSASYILTMSEKELYTVSNDLDNTKEEIENNTNKREENNNIFNSKSEISCKKCRSKNIYYYELQTRSADEGATVHYRCEDCNFHWKNSG